MYLNNYPILTLLPYRKQQEMKINREQIYIDINIQQ